MRKHLLSLLFLLVCIPLASCSTLKGEAPVAPTSDLVGPIVKGTLEAVLSATPVPSDTPEPSLTPTPTLSAPAGWVIYKSEEFGFELAHPNLFDCKDQCSMSAFINLGDIQHLVTLAVQSTLKFSGEPFDAISFDIFQNPDGFLLQDFVEQEKQAILAGPMPIGPPTDENPVTIAEQTGIKMGFGGNVSAAIYLPFPTGHQILIISICNASEGSFEGIAEQILATLRFTR